MNYDEPADFAEKRAFIRDLLLYLEPFSGSLREWHALEIGGGGGVLAGLLAPHFARIICTDLDDPVAHHGGRLHTLLEEKFERNGEQFPLNRVQFLAADAQDLPFKDQLFDFCYSQNTFEHVPDPESAIREAIRVTRPGGLVYLQFDPVWTADSGSHFQDGITEPWVHLLEDDEALIARMQASGASEQDKSALLTAMNRKPISYYREMFPRLIEQYRMDVLLHHEWSGTVTPDWTEHPNLAKAATRLGLPTEDLLVRGMRYLLRKPPLQ
jgi:ubiquinone/menaquinone biosynthesis C-methylase UbiE